MNHKKIILQNKDVYNNIATHFSDTRSFLWRDLEILAQFAKDGDSILDIGCGNGRLYQLFAGLSSDESQLSSSRPKPQGRVEGSPIASSIKFFGVDISEKLIEIAKEKYPEGKFFVGDMVELPFEDKKFDVVFSLVAFHHLPTADLQLKALEEMKRVLKPNGKIILLNWNAYSNWVNDKLKKGDYKDLGNHLFEVPWKTGKGEKVGDRVYYGFTLEELEGLFEKTGFKLEDQYFLRHGERIGVELGMNIVSILEKA